MKNRIDLRWISVRTIRWFACQASVLGMLTLQTTRADILLADNFESYATGAWPSSNWAKDANAVDDPANNQVQNSPGGSAGKSLKMFGALGSCWGANGYRGFTLTPSFTVEFDVYNGSESLTGCHPDRAYVVLRQGTFWGNYAQELIGFYGDGKIKSHGVILGQYQLARWYHVNVTYNRSGNQLSLGYWLDGEYLGKITATITNATGENSLDHLNVSVQEGSVWLDNIHVTSGCPGDADCDGLPDDWEASGVDVGGAHLDLPAMGANRLRCSPKVDPPVMRVVEARKGGRNSYEAKTT